MNAPAAHAQAQPFSQSPAENYERYFVPAIGAPMAEDLIRAAALQPGERVLDRGGRVLVNVPGPKPPLFAIMTEALARHVAPQAAAFADVVFSLYDVDAIAKLVRDAGFSDVKVQARPKPLRLPLPADFFRQYVHSTPLIEPVSKVSAEQRAALEEEVCGRWQALVREGALPVEVGMTTAAARA